MINASFEQIEKVEKHPNADKLDVVTVSGYTVVSQKDTLKAGDIVFFIREDSQILVDEQKFPWHTGIKTYLGKNGRVKTIKLRGIFSSGIVIPYMKIINTIPNVIIDNEVKSFNLINKELEDEEKLKEYCGIKHYVPPAVGASFGNLQMEGTIPFGIPKTDEENVQNIEKSELPLGEEVLVTRKLDGTSCTVIFDNDGKYHICGRNYEYKLGQDNIYERNTKPLVDFILEIQFYKQLKENEHLVIQGEVAGKGIQTNKINKISQTEEPRFYIFRTMLWNDKDRTKVDWGNLGSKYHFLEIRRQLTEEEGHNEIYGIINTVPILGREILTEEMIQKYINAPAEDGEGVVINHKNGHFKIKSLDYISKF